MKASIPRTGVPTIVARKKSHVADAQVDPNSQINHHAINGRFGTPNKPNYDAADP